jgi:peptide subunit release factor 1 (eRF1)
MVSFYCTECGEKNEIIFINKNNKKERVCEDCLNNLLETMNDLFIDTNYEVYEK